MTFIMSFCSGDDVKKMKQLQTTLGCVERGLLLLRMKDEARVNIEIDYIFGNTCTDICADIWKDILGRTCTR